MGNPTASAVFKKQRKQRKRITEKEIDILQKP